jgi:hypothetical protein
MMAKNRNKNPIACCHKSPKKENRNDGIQCRIIVLGRIGHVFELFEIFER